MCSGYSTCSKLFFIFLFTNLIQKEPVIVRFPNENICIAFTNGMFSWYTFSYDTRKPKSKSFLSLEKKETFACPILGNICYVACAINCTGKLICLCACLHEHDRAGLSLTSLVNPRTLKMEEKDGELLLNWIPLF